MSEPKPWEDIVLEVVASETSEKLGIPLADVRAHIFEHMTAEQVHGWIHDYYGGEPAPPYMSDAEKRRLVRYLVDRVLKRIAETTG